MKYHRLFILVGLPVALGLASYLLRSELFPNAEPTVVEGPILEFAETIHLGRCRPGEHTARLAFTNKGNQSLILDQFSTSCGCMALLADNPNASVSRFEGTTIPPSGQVTIIVRVAIQAAPEKAFVASISFRTNEPGKPTRTVLINAERSNPIQSDPGELILGSLQPGERVFRTIFLSTGNDDNTPAVDRIEFLRTDLFIVRRREVTESEQRASPRRLIAALEISATLPSSPCVIEDKIKVFGRGDFLPSLTIPVVGVVHARYLISPSNVVLPIITGDGAVYGIECLCRQTDGRPFRIEVAEGAGLRIVLSSPEQDKPTHRIRIEWPQKEIPEGNQAETRTVRFLVKDGEDAEETKLTVSCRGMEGQR